MARHAPCLRPLHLLSFALLVGAAPAGLVSPGDLHAADDTQPQKAVATGNGQGDVQLVFAGDIVLADLVEEAIARGVDPFAECAGILKEADATIGNLESERCLAGSTQTRANLFAPTFWTLGPMVPFGFCVLCRRRVFFRCEVLD